MTKLPTHHHIWSRASNSTRVSILARRQTSSSRKYYHQVASAPEPQQHQREASASTSATPTADAWVDVGASWASHGSWQAVESDTLSSDSGPSRTIATAPLVKSTRPRAAVYYVPPPRAIPASIAVVQRHHQQHTQRAVRQAAPRPIRYGLGNPAPSVAQFSTSTHRPSALQPSLSNEIDDIEALVSQFDTQAALAATLAPAWVARQDDFPTGTSVVQLWGPAPASIGPSVSSARLSGANHTVNDPSSWPSVSAPSAARSRNSSSIHVAPDGSIHNGGAGGSRSAGGHGSNADDSGSGSDSDWSSSSRATFQNRSTAGNGSPSPSPGPGSSSTFNNNANQNSSNSSNTNNTSNPTPFPFPAPRVSRKSPSIIHPLDVPTPNVDSPRALSVSHHIDTSAYDLPLYEFQHGAYGIPKRHPLAAASSGGSRGANTSQPQGPSSRPRERRGVLGIAADFLAGPMAPSPEPPQPPPSKPSTGQRQWKRIDPDHLRSVQVGEDAYFLRPDSLGIADGVGGWATRPGANPAMFSRLLMHFCSVELSRYDRLHESGDKLGAQELQQKFWDVDPVEVMQRAWERCVRVAREEGILGSSTALLAMLRGDQLRIANLGDCVLLIVRQGELLFRSQEQQHSFNFPVQLGMMIKRGTRDVEELLKGWSTAASNGEESLHASSSRAVADEAAFDAPESEATIRRHARHLRRANAHLLGGNREIDAEEKQREEDALRRRAEFEGKDMKEFEAELQANKEFDFDVNTGAKSRTANEGEAANHETTDDGKTVYVGIDDEHPWDEPHRDCGRWTIAVEKGDIIIVASDGLVDNLFDDDILEEVQRFAPPPSSPEHRKSPHAGSSADDYQFNDDLPHDLRRDSGIDLAAMANGHGPEPSREPRHLSSSAYPPPAFSPQLLSEALCSRAKAISQDSKAIISPFQQKATEEGLHYVGGKHDDISVLVAVVGEASHRRAGVDESASAGEENAGSGQQQRFVFHSARAGGAGK